ncbi:MAG: GntR family transcriptional regulator [Gammaproteobacteria bacterium]|nr:GntR family transcriptional regulator [Gammaproteobacteria bacterium]MDH3536315.1 GntR family transcriptional regulator [Gammaproteobacteria bacterium]
MDKQAIYDDLKKRILTLELEPGAALDEARLSEHYRISRTPLREILRGLAGEGCVDIVNNRGAYVSSMSHKVLRDFFVTAPMIYAAIGRLAAQNAKPSQIHEMREIQEKFRAAIAAQATADMVYCNQCFHALMGEMADNPYLKPSYDRLLIDHARISQTFYRPRDPQMAERMYSALDHHDQMIAAIEAGDSKTMVDLIVEHWELSRDLVEYFVKPDPLAYDMAAANS